MGGLPPKFPLESLKEGQGSRSGQEEKVNCEVAATKALADPVGSLELWWPWQLSPIGAFAPHIDQALEMGRLQGESITLSRSAPFG